MLLLIILRLISLQVAKSLICSSGDIYPGSFGTFDEANCISCRTSSECDECASEYLLYKGMCFPYCIPPYYPMIDLNEEIFCSKSNDVFLETSKILISEYSSEQPYKVFTLYLEPSQLIIEFNFWLKVSSSSEYIGGTNLFVWSHIKRPLFSLPREIPILNLTLDGDAIILEGIEKDIKIQIDIDKWNYISVFGQFPTEAYPYILRSISSITTEMRVDYELESSSEIIQSPTFLVIGNLHNVSKYFEIKNLFSCLLSHNQRYLGQMDIISKGNYIFMLVSNISKGENIENNISLVLDHIRDFSSNLLELRIILKDYDLPSKIISIYVDKHLVYESSIIIYENSICMNESGIIYFIENSQISIYLGILRMKNEFLIVKKDKVLSGLGNSIIISTTGFAKDQMTYSIEELIITNSPSIFQNFIFVKRSVLLSPEQNQNQNKTLRNITFASNFPIPKFCKSDLKSSYYLFSKDECLDYQMNCVKFGSNCLTCVEKSCEICAIGSYLYKGVCGQFCEDYLNLSIEKLRYCFITVFDCRNINLEHRCYNIMNLCFQLHNSPEICLDYLYPENHTRIEIENPFIKLCPENCEICSKSASKLKCHKCKSGFKLYNDQCLSNCPDDTFNLNSECLKECLDSTMLTISGEKNCYKCIECTEGIRYIKLCPTLFCGAEKILRKGICTSPTSNDCLFGKDDYCYHCQNNYFSFQGICLESHISSGLLKYPHYEFFFTFQDVRMKCPQHCSTCNLDNLNLPPNFECLERNSINLIEENTSQNFKYQNNRYENYCPEYLEGLLIIYFKEACIKIPNLHFIIFQPYSFYYNTSLNLDWSKDNMRVNQIKICNQTSSDSILCLEKCPQNFLQIYDECYLKENYTAGIVNMRDSMNSELLPERYSIYWSEENILAIGSVIENKKCPKTCKTCYFTGNDVKCSECADPSMKLDKDFGSCLCNFSHPYFDFRSSKCMNKCDESMLISRMDCVQSCMEAKIYSEMSRAIYRYRDKCVPRCNSASIPMVDVLNLDEIICVDADSFAFIEDRAETINNRKVIDSDWLRKIWRNGLIYFRKKLTSDFKPINLKKLLIDFKIQNNTESKYLFNSIIIYLGFKQADLENEFVFLDLAENISYSFNNDSYFAYKLSYFGLIFSQFFQRNFTYRLQHSFYGSFSLIKGDLLLSSILKIKKIQIKLSVAVNDCAFYYNQIEYENMLILGLRIGSQKSKSDCYSNLTFISNLSPYKYASIANLTSDVAQALELGSTNRLHPKCNYFLRFSVDKALDEKLSIMIENDLYYHAQPKKEVEVDKEIKDDENQADLKIIIIVICAIIGALFLFCTYKYFKRRIDDGMKIKFVQMAEIDSDEEEN